MSIEVITAYKLQGARGGSYYWNLKREGCPLPQMVLSLSPEEHSQHLKMQQGPSPT